VALIISATVLLIGKFTNLKWNTASFLFIAAESGFYMTSANPRLQGSYFSAEWSEIVGYSVKNVKNDKATVTVYFDGPADCGSLGKVTSLDMVNITGLETLRTVFSDYNIAERNAK
ncbi:MAG: hypothetical protein K2K24_00270, partial [Clostridia bacterium]|nr:hypothetical protein [Clostridia bacterium]